MKIRLGPWRYGKSPSRMYWRRATSGLGMETPPRWAVTLINRRSPQMRTRMEHQCDVGLRMLTCGGRRAHGKGAPPLWNAALRLRP